MRITWIIYTLILVISGFYVLANMAAKNHSRNVRSAFYRGCTMGHAKVARDNDVELSSTDIAQYCEDNAQLFSETLTKVNQNE